MKTKSLLLLIGCIIASLAWIQLSVSLFNHGLVLTGTSMMIGLVIVLLFTLNYKFKTDEKSKK